MTGLPRRRVAIAAVVQIALLRQAFASDAVKQPLKSEIERWAEEAATLASDLQAEQLTVAQWQAATERLNARVSLSELLRYIDFERIAQDLQLENERERSRRIVLPKVAAIELICQVFVVPAERAILPHAHNNLVSSHLILDGQARVRTFDRVEDFDGGMLLRPTRDSQLGPGASVTMSSAKDNVHWFAAEKTPVFMLNVNMPADVEAPPGGPVRFNQRGRRIYVDPTDKPRGDGLIVASRMTETIARTKFGRV